MYLEPIPLRDVPEGVYFISGMYLYICQKHDPDTNTCKVLRVAVKVGIIWKATQQQEEILIRSTPVTITF